MAPVLVLDIFMIDERVLFHQHRRDSRPHAQVRRFFQLLFGHLSGNQTRERIPVTKTQFCTEGSLVNCIFIKLESRLSPRFLCFFVYQIVHKSTFCTFFFITATIPNRISCAEDKVRAYAANKQYLILKVSWYRYMCRAA